MSTVQMSIAARQIGNGAPPYIIAEVGINHEGSVKKALQLIDAAQKAGADAVKLQTFITDRFLARTSPYFDLLSGAELTRPEIHRLHSHAAERGIVLFSAVFDEESADLWAALDVPAYKIASCDITHLPLLRHVAKYGKPVIISTGGATMAEVHLAKQTVLTANPDTPVAFLHCVSEYPASTTRLNLACMATMRREIDRPVGFSDHTQGSAAAIAAAALGADIIEKHFTLDSSAPGWDHSLSADPEEMRRICALAKDAFASSGSAEKHPVEAPEAIAAIRRSITAFKDITKGTVISRDMLAVTRPGTGLAPDMMDQIIGKVALTDIRRETPIVWDHLSRV